MKTALLLLILALTHANIYVYSPDSLRQTITNKYGNGNQIPSSLANFGNPPYGSIMVGRVFYTEQENQNDACGNLKQIDFTGDPDIINTPILLVDRGGCTFSQKVRHAQNIGARAVVIADNKDENVSNVIMADDGSAGNIYIPSFLISKSDGDIIKSSIHGAFGWEVALELTFQIAQQSSIVEYQLFMTSSNPLIREFLYNFSEIATQFNEKEMIFTPHYVFWFCIECRNEQYTVEDPDCFSGGKYCAPDPDGSGPRNGRDIVMEDLRQMCIYQQRKNEKQWWKYIQHHYKECNIEHFSETCSQEAAKKAKIDWAKVKKCINSSWEGQNPYMDENKMLRQEKEIWLNSGLSFFPVIVINNQQYRGDIEPDAVIEALCAGFKSYNAKCMKILWGDQDQKKHSGISTFTIVCIIICSLALIVTILFFYRRYIRTEMKKEMKTQITTAVSQYFALTDQGAVRNASIETPYS